MAGEPAQGQGGQGYVGPANNNGFRSAFREDKRQTADTSGAQAQGDKGNQPGNKGGNGGGNGENNPPNDEDFVNNIWKQTVDPNAPKPGDNKADPNNPNPNPNPNPNNPAPTQQERVANYLKQNGLEPIVLTEAQQAGLKDGSISFADFLPALNEKIANSHLKAVQNTKALIDDAVSKAVKEAVTTSTSRYEGDKLRAALHEELPFTKDELISPVAETVLGRFMAKPGATKDQAIRATKLYFEKMAERVNGGSASTNSQVRGNGGGRGGPVTGDWLDVLAPNNGG